LSVFQRGTKARGAISNYWLQTRVLGDAPNDVDQERFIKAWADLALRLAPARKRR
jgi:hypothetical protein